VKIEKGRVGFIEPMLALAVTKLHEGNSNKHADDFLMVDYYQPVDYY
jgi:hypothetical protein